MFTSVASASPSTFAAWSASGARRRSSDRISSLSSGSVIGRPITEPELRELILSEDRRLAPLADHAAKVLGEALATLVNILNPGKVVLSGEGAWLLNHTLRRIVHAMNSNVFDGLSDELEVRVEERGDEFWAAGAAGLLLDDVFHPRLQRA